MQMMKKKRGVKFRSSMRVMAERLEARQLLSATPVLFYGPDTFVDVPPAAGATSQAVVTAAQPAHLVITPIFDSTITNDPNAAAIEGALNTAIGNFEASISTPITVTIKFQEINTGLAQSLTARYTTTYSAFRSALASHASSARDSTVLANLPTGSFNPVNGATTVKITTANARALGFSAPAPNGIDSTIGLNMSLFNTDRYNVDPDKYDLVGSSSHEMDEVLGINSALTGLQNGDAAPSSFIFSEDLFRFDGNGNRSFNTDVNANAYFSIDGGNTLLDTYNQEQGQDFNDWSHPPNDNPQVQDAQGTPGAEPNLAVELIVLDVLGYNLASGVNGGYLPDLVPYRLATWSAPVVVNITAGAVADSPVITTNDTVYFDAAFINEGEIFVPSSYVTTMTLDGAVKQTFSDPANLTIHTAEFSTGIKLGKLSAGTHTLTMSIDSNSQVKEISEANNTFSRTFTVGGAAQADWVPYTPAGWSAPIVVGTAAGGTTDAKTITTANTIFVDFAYLNDGNASVTKAFDVVLKLDGTTAFTLNDTTVPYGAGEFGFYTDLNGGKLSAGTHTIEMIIDSTNVIAESDESNNTFTKTFTVGGTVSKPAITTQPKAQSVASGAKATFTAAASGSPTPTVQWQISTNGGTSYSNISAATSTTYSFTTSSGQNADLFRAVFTNSQGTATTSGVQLTVTSAAKGSISGTVFNDVNGNGTKDSGDAGISGVVVYNDTNNNGSKDSGELSTTTNSSGVYNFSGLAAGAYIIRAVLPTGRTQSAPASNAGWHVTLAAGQAVTGDNFGEKAPAANASITGTVFNDVNANGKKDSGDAGISGVVIYNDTNNNGKKDSGELSVTTSSGGVYTFSGLAAGSYIIREVLPTGVTQTAPAGNAGWHLTLAAGQASSGDNFGEKPPAATASITGTVFNDVNSNGIKDSGDAGISGIVLYDDLNNNGKLDSGELSVKTNSSGVYLFSKLAAGSYVIREVRPSGKKQTSPASNAGWHLTVAAGQAITGKNFGEH